jgi:hypothetical protein
MLNGIRKQDFARVRPERPKPLGPEFNPWFWNPNRGSIKTAPDWFKAKLEGVADTLAVTWDPITERWLVWDRCGRINHPLCQGWRLLFIHKGVDGEYLPLDERLFARLFAASADAHGNAKEYFLRVATEMERDRAKAEAASLDDTIQHAMETFNHSQISVAMRGQSSGSKFSTYHS